MNLLSRGAERSARAKGAIICCKCFLGHCSHLAFSLSDIVSPSLALSLLTWLWSLTLCGCPIKQRCRFYSSFSQMLNARYSFLCCNCRSAVINQVQRLVADMYFPPSSHVFDVESLLAPFVPSV